MLKKYISKFTIDILPSVLATIIGAYIVNHYIATKPDAPAAARQEAVRATAPEPPRLSEAPKVVPGPAPQPLPPPIMVSAPSSEGAPTGSLPAKPSYAAQAADPRRPTPPADIPLASRPL